MTISAPRPALFLSLAAILFHLPLSIRAEPEPTVHRATPTVTPQIYYDEEEEESSSAKTILGYPKKTFEGPPAQIHSSKMFVGQEISYPSGYTPARVLSDPTGHSVVVPASPTSFQTRQLGVTIETGTTSKFENTELKGFVNYGSPIQSVVSVKNEKGETIGTQIISTPNPILQPVFQTIKEQR
ncbi:hypothetical protein EBU02_01110 [bacterium]|nr:hypothetical protein [bacterium]NBS52142.1 hypothetical protein [Spartobacteria bacterium]